MPSMPERPRPEGLLPAGFGPVARMHMLQSARVARENGLNRRVITACLLHDVAIAGLLQAGPGYWGAQINRTFIVMRKDAGAIEKTRGAALLPR